MNNSILLTGATSGLGFAVLSELVENKHQVVAIGRQFDAISKSFGSKHPLIHTLKVDLGNIDEIRSIFDFLESQKIQLNSFIHCAGFEETVPLKQYDHDRIQKIFSVNLFSAIEILKYFSLKKFSVNGSSVVLIASVMGNLGQTGKVGYCSSKAAIGGLVKSASLELARRKIRVNSVSPGIIKTQMVEKLFEKIGKHSENEIVNSHPLGIGNVSDVVPTILFLAVGKSTWITGIDLVIDGGYSAK